eukprot:7125197-Prymnesium_polylepis.1
MRLLRLERKLLRKLDNGVKVEHLALLDDPAPPVAPRVCDLGIVLLVGHPEELVPAHKHAVGGRWDRGRREGEAGVHGRVVGEQQHIAGLRVDAHPYGIGRRDQNGQGVREGLGLGAGHVVLPAGRELDLGAAPREDAVGHAVPARPQALLNVRLRLQHPLIHLAQLLQYCR